MIDLSICIPLTRLRKETLTTLKNLALNRSHKINFEVILSFDGPMSQKVLNANQDMIESLAIKKIVSKRRFGAAHARNKAAKIARGKNLLFVDSDVVLPENFLDDFSRSEVKSHTLYTAHVLPIKYESLISHIFSAYVLAPRYSFERKIRNIAFATAWISRETFLETHGFDENFPSAGGEDYEFSERCVSLGLNIVESNMYSYHSNPTNLKQFIKRVKSYANEGFLLHEIRTQNKKSESNRNLPNLFTNGGKLNLGIVISSIGILLKKLTDTFLISKLTRTRKVKKWKHQLARLKAVSGRVAEQHNLFNMHFSYFRWVQTLLLIFLWRFVYVKEINKIQKRKSKERF